MSPPKKGKKKGPAKDKRTSRKRRRADPSSSSSSTSRSRSRSRSRTPEAAEPERSGSPKNTPKIKTPSKTPAKSARKRNEIIWQHFEERANPDGGFPGAACNHCAMVIKRALGNTTNMTQHLERHHYNKFVEYKKAMAEHQKEKVMHPEAQPNPVHLFIFDFEC